MAENTNTEREAFEAWIKSELPSVDLTREGDGYYRHLADEWWLAFQAGRASLSLPAAGQEPVAWLSPWRADRVTTDYDAYGEHGIPLYAAPQPAVAAGREQIAEAALLKVLTAVQRYLPPDGPEAKDTLSEIIEIVDPWPLGHLEKS